jgi:hypothetical protein
MKNQAMKAKTVLAALIISTATAVSGAASAQEDAVESLTLSVNCRDSAELTRQICFPQRVSKLDVQLLPTMTGGAQIADNRIEDGGCVRVTLKVYGERQYSPQSPGSFESRAAKARDPLQVAQCVGTIATAFVKVKY